MQRTAASTMLMRNCEIVMRSCENLLCGLDAPVSSACSSHWSASPKILQPEVSRWGQLVLSRGFARKTPSAATADATKAKENAETVKVVLLQGIPALGVKGSVVEANAGWMRHQLFPLGQAVYATPKNIEQYSMTLEQRAKEQDPEKEAQRRLAKLVTSLSTMNVNISRRNDWWKKQPDVMLGSVTAYDILKAAERQYGIRLHESHLFIEGPITTFGTFKIPLNLRTKEDRQIELTVSVNSVRWINHGHASS